MTEHFVIDVFNLAYSAARLGRSGSLPDIKALVYELESYCALKDKRLTLVFDGSRYQGEFAPSKGVNILFSKPGQTADAVVERFIINVPVPERLHWTVISDDLALKRMAAGMGLRTMTTSALLSDVRGTLDAKRKSAQSGVPKPFNNPFEDKL